jgi:peptidyl-prolyl cis-trans isomerase B (cyclophilin B)
MSAAGRVAFRPVRKTTALLALILALAGLFLAACGEGEDSAGEEESSLTADSPCEPAEVPEPREVDLEPPPSKPSAPKLTAVVETTCGSFEIALDTKGNPKTAASFEYLAEEGVLDGTPFHRIVPGFVIQAGDPAGTGSGPGPGYSVDEPPPADTSYTRGIVAMAKTEAEPPGRSGSQFFVVTAADAGLPPDYAIAGEVTKGFDVVETIEGFGDPQSGETGTPLDTVLVESVTIEAG